ncbi:hypothetical protein Tco_1373955, partial [Tanacetum coccineum]
WCGGAVVVADVVAKVEVRWHRGDEMVAKVGMAWWGVRQLREGEQVGGGRIM